MMDMTVPGRASYMNELNELYRTKAYADKPVGSFGVYSVSYIPAVLGIWVGRLLHLNFTDIFMLGKFFNLLTYALLFAAAIRRIPYGKVLLACIGMLPTSVFMAASYAYDPWLIAFSALSFSYLFAIIAEEGKMKNKDFVIMVGSMVLGCLVKAVYFSSAFSNAFLFRRINISLIKIREQQSLLYLLRPILLVLSFILPMLISSGQYI